MIHAVIIDKEANRPFWESLSCDTVDITVCSCISDLPCCDAVLISDDMSETDITDVLASVRKQEGFKSLPTAAVIEDHSAEKQEALLASGFDDIIHMPLCKSLILKRIEGLSYILPYSLSDEGFNIDSLMDIRDDGRNGAYSVHSGDFANIYRFVLRILHRLRKSAQVLMISLNGGSDDSNRRRKVMQSLTNAVRNCLRRGDMASVCGDRQIVVLLLGADDDGGHLVANRIVSSFYSECTDDSYSIDYDIREVVTQ